MGLTITDGREFDEARVLCMLLATMSAAGDEAECTRRSRKRLLSFCTAVIGPSFFELVLS